MTFIKCREHCGACCIAPSITGPIPGMGSKPGGVRCIHLTPDLRCDKRLCAYLKMNLTSKEMAPLLNMTVRSVEMTRYRLRVKLGLSRDTNLADFLSRF